MSQRLLNPKFQEGTEKCPIFLMDRAPKIILHFGKTNIFFAYYMFRCKDNFNHHVLVLATRIIGYIFYIYEGFLKFNLNTKFTQRERDYYSKNQY